MISITGYKIIKPIGQGGMATVYLAIQESVGREVAIKVMSPSLSSDPTFSERFIKEARMASLVHPHIITVFDAGEVDGQNYIVMEYANGGNLDKLIKQGIDVARSVEIISEIASALHHSAKKGFIHRDVKPENILFREDGSAILVDFGIAKAITAGTQLTTVGTTIGSPNYMSPEQTRGLDLDGRSDLYSLGIVLFETLTGRKPFDADDTFVIGIKHINDPLPQLPEELQDFQPIIDKLLAKDPDDRFENGEALVKALSTIDCQNLASVKVDKSHAPIGDEKTRMSKKSQERETLVVNLDGEATQVASSNTETDDKTRIAEKTVVDSTIVRDATPTEKKSYAGPIVFSLVVLCSLAAAGYWYVSTQPEEDPPAKIAAPTEAPKPSEASPITDSSKTTEKAPVEVAKVDVPDEAVIKARRIAELLKNGRAAFRAKRYTTPENENALYYFEEVLALDSENADAKKGIDRLAEKYVDLANLQYKRKEYSSALRFIDKGLYVKDNNQALLDLRDIIYGLQQEEKATLANKLKRHKSILKKDKEALKVTGVHIDKDPKVAAWHAKQDFMNLLYNKILQQCNQSTKRLSHPDCVNTYARYLKQWPLPLHALNHTEAGESGVEVTSKFEFKRASAKKAYKSALENFRLTYHKSITNEFADKADLISLANYSLYTPLVSVLGMRTTANLDETLQTNLETWRNLSPVIENRNTLIDKISSLIDGKVYIHPFVSHNSFEITPFANSLHHQISNELGTTTQETADLYLQGEYEIKSNGEIHLDLWLFDKNDQIVNLEPLKLARAITNQERHTPMFFNNTFLPVDHLTQAYGFPAEVSIANQSSSALLITGDKAELKVKLDSSGFYFIAVHVKRKREEYSYLLPLHIANVPFVQVATRSTANHFVTLGEFQITPPLGVEALQLIAASVNLEKFLPAYTWHEKRQQFVINGSEGNIAQGIAKVREKANQISKNSQRNGIRWQERILVTTILDDPN